MAYNRVAGNHIAFYYTKDSLFSNVNVRTQYRAKNIKDKNGDSQNDDYAISNDESDAFAIFVKEAVINCYQMVLKLTTGLSDGLFIDETYSGVSPIATHVYGFKIVDEQAYNENNLDTVEDGIKQFIIASIMCDWWNLVGYTEEEAKWLGKREDIKRDLKTNRLAQLRKHKLS